MNPTAPFYSTRGLSAVLIAAFAGLALWLFVPAFGDQPSGGESSPARLATLLEISGQVTVHASSGEVTSIDVPIAVRGDRSLDLAGARLRAETELAETAFAAVPAAFTIEWASGNGDQILDPGESATIHVDIPSNSSVYEANPLDLTFVPQSGPTLIIKDVLAR